MQKNERGRRASLLREMLAKVWAVACAAPLQRIFQKLHLSYSESNRGSMSSCTPPRPDVTASTLKICEILSRERNKIVL